MPSAVGSAPAWDRLCRWSYAAAGLNLDAGAVERLQRFLATLRVWNQKMALVSQDDLDVLVDRHVADSLFAAAHCSNARRIADLGSGAGFPGLVIAIVRPETHVALIEARGKKVSFLEEACRSAGIANADPVHGRIEVVAAQQPYRASHDRVTSRALTDLDQLHRLAMPLATSDATLLAMRSASTPVPPGAQRVDYTLPDGTPRALLRIPLA